LTDAGWEPHRRLGRCLGSGSRGELRKIGLGKLLLARGDSGRPDTYLALVEFYPEGIWLRGTSRFLIPKAWIELSSISGISGKQLVAYRGFILVEIEERETISLDVNRIKVLEKLRSAAQWSALVRSE